MFNKKIFFCITFFVSLLFCSNCFAQQKVDTTKLHDSTSRKNILALDTSAKKYNPKVATFRSAIIPGWGQAYNKKYWKIPIIYGALGITAGVFRFNLKTYKKLKEAIILRSDNDPANDTLVDPQFINLSTESIRSYRNAFRQNVDYSVLFFLVFWGLNVVDATVDAHLKSFDVGSDLSMKFKIGSSGGNPASIGFVLAFKDKQSKVLSSPR